MKGLVMRKEEERNIYAVFDDKTIRVYQAYNNEMKLYKRECTEFCVNSKYNIRCVKIFV